MPLTATSYDLIAGSATVIAGPSQQPLSVLIRNNQPVASAEGYSRRGYTFAIATSFNVPASGTASYALTTGVHGAQFQYYSIITETSSVDAFLIEGATVGTAAGTLPSYNLDRTASRTATSVLGSATSVTGGTTVSAEFLTTTKQAGEAFSSFKILTLAGSSRYAMQFVNQANQTTKVHFQLGWAEQYDGGHDVYLGGAVGSALRLPPENTYQFTLLPLTTLTAQASQACNIGVLVERAHN